MGAGPVTESDMTQAKVTREGQQTTDEILGIEGKDLELRKLEDLELLLVGGGENMPTWP